MNTELIFWPVLLQVLLSLLLYIPLITRKFRAVKLNEVNLKDSKVNNQAWPAYVVQVSNNIANQFESPILFYVLCFILSTGYLLNPVALGLAWAYVLTRCLHSYVHLYSNYVPLRMRVFTVSWFLLCGLLGFVVFELLR